MMSADGDISHESGARPANEAVHANDRLSRVVSARQARHLQGEQDDEAANSNTVGGTSTSEIRKTITTTTSTTTTNESSKQSLEERINQQPEVQSHEPLESVAIVEELGRQASVVGNNTTTHSIASDSRRLETTSSNYNVSVDGHNTVTSIGTIAAQSSASRIVVALLKDGDSFQLKVQEMRPRIFEVGANLRECQRYLQEHERILRNLEKQRQAPLECWLNKYQRVQAAEPNMSAEMKLVYMCMAENLQGCWRALLGQLEARLQLLNETCRFYQLIERLSEALAKAESHVQVFRQQFLDGPGSLRFNQAANELRRLNELVQVEYSGAREKQRHLVQLIAGLASGNLGDSRANYLIQDGQNLINYINSYLDPLERRKIQLESVIRTTTTTTTTSTTTSIIDKKQQNGSTRFGQQDKQMLLDANSGARKQQLQLYLTPSGRNNSISHINNNNNNNNNKTSTTTTTNSSVLREISSFNDLNLAENWLTVKIDQLNSSLLSSLGIGVQDSRPILAKHEQIALECSAIEEATLKFNGKNIHAIKQVDLTSSPAQQQQQQQQPSNNNNNNTSSLFEQQKLLATKTRDVITILDARIVLLRRTIDFYLRAKDATADIGKMMRRLQVDNSLQSVQFVANELELKDVSSVVASGATIISELQQLQLAQKHGQRSSIVNLNLETGGIRTVIDRLNQDLAHLKTVLNQRRLVLLNEDATKMAQNFSNKCHQLQAWLNTHAKAYLLANNRITSTETTTTTTTTDMMTTTTTTTPTVQQYLQAPRAFLDGHEQLRLTIQNKTLEVEALLRLLSTLTESFDAKSAIADEIQRDTDELRQDWINVTNCLEKRIELIRKYLAILNTMANLDKEMDCIDPSAANGRPKTPDERSDDDIRANIEQSLAQLTNLVRNFASDCKRTNTALVYLAQPSGHQANAPITGTTNDINKDQLVDQANSLLKSLANRTESLASGKGNKNNIKIAANKTKSKVRNERQAANKTSVITSDEKTSTKTTTTTTTTTTSNQQVDARPPVRHPLGGRTNVVPIFTRPLSDRQVKPFSVVELECELDPKSIEGGGGGGSGGGGGGDNVQVEWLMNNYKKIPANIKHSIVNEANIKHKLVINQFNPTCCGSYTAKATNKTTGQWATTSCRLSLSGIKEDEDGNGTNEHLATSATTTTTTTTATSTRFNTSAVAASPDVSTASSFSQWRPASNNGNNQHRTEDKRALERIIRGVDSSEAGSDAEQPHRPMAKRTTTTTTNTTTKTSDINAFPITRTTYNPQQAQGAAINNNNNISNNNHQVRNINYIDSPTHSSSTNLSRSISRSPFGGTPQPPVFMQTLRKESSSPQAGELDGRSSSRSGLVCVVVGNPPPTIEWMHNSVPIATARCARGSSTARANICKLTIETGANRDGQYVCRASNRLGQTTTALTLTK